MLREGGAAERTRVWTIDLGDPVWDEMVYTLAKQECQRAENYKSPEARRRFQRRRVALRAILAHCQGLLPEKVVLEFGQFGKPRTSSAKFCFNASHSRDVAVVATCSVEVGIDIEFVSADFALGDDLLDSVCNPTELEALASVDCDQRRAIFFELWASKEAFAKAVGAGLQLPFTEIGFLPVPDRSDVREVIEVGRTTGHAYFVHEVAVPEGYSAKLCLPASAADIESVQAERLLQRTTDRASGHLQAG